MKNYKVLLHQQAYEKALLFLWEGRVQVTVTFSWLPYKRLSIPDNAVLTDSLILPPPFKPVSPEN